ncbi:class I SAM-dependent methyltransferase [Streptomyces acidiscabies]|uniref:class I SAM-dependent methyltransferase n=1 Tax=Streptomyces acidiscabies TaxID=42234 RepID=UPI000952EF69|nr:class I SAM-dependent methyltransferase [Streptomyces acidiscabies]
MTANPFLDPSLHGELYGGASRLANRSSALRRAKTSGPFVPDTIVRLARTHHAETGFVLDIGCGRGTSTRALAEGLRPECLVGVDAAPALLTDAGERAEARFVQADFHRLPVRGGSCDLAVAAFCLYHSPRPADALAEISRVLAPGGLAVLVTKSLDSYRELDALVTAAGLDVDAEYRESLYASAHSGNLAALAATALDVLAVHEEEHRFTFCGHGHTAQYLATNPKYHFAPGLYGNADALAAALAEALPDRPVTTRSTVTYVVARTRHKELR